MDGAVRTGAKPGFPVRILVILVDMEVNYPWPQDAPQQPAPLASEFLQRGRTEGKNDWWRYTLGIVISMAGYFLFSVPILLIMMKGVAQLGITEPEEMTRAMTNPNILGVDTNVFLILLMLGYVGGMIGLYLAVRFLHRKNFISIITAAKRIRWNRFFVAALAWFIFSCICIFIAWIIDPANLQFTFNLKPFLITLGIAVLFLPAQTWWEEFLLRGYLMQGIAQTTKTALIPIIATSLIFGLLHAGNPEVAAYGFWYSMPMYILPGLLFATIAILDGGLEIPMGFHFANNLFGTIAVTNDVSAIQASTIFRQVNPDQLIDLLALVQYPLFLFLFWMIYKWDFKKLYK